MTPGLLAGSIAIQAIGTLSTFALLVVVARLGGAALQGQYALMKSWVDFAGVVAQLGFPQAFIFVVNKGMAARGTLAAWSARYAFAAAAVAIVSAGMTAALGFFGGGSAPVLALALCLGLSVGLLTYHRLIRSLLLTVSDGFAFAVFTILPNCALVAAVVIVLAGAMPLEWAFLASALIAAACAVLVARGFPDRDRTRPLPLAAMVRQSWLMLVQTALVTAQPLLLFWICGLLGASTGDIGRLSVATVSLTAANAVFGMIAPILFNRWSKSLTRSRSTALFASIGKAALAAFLLVCVALPLIPWLVPAVFGAEFAAAVPVMQIISLALPAALYTQVAVPAFFGLGRVVSVIYASAARVAVALGALAAGGLVAGGADIIHAAAWAWLLAEWIAAATLFVAAARLGREQGAA